MDEKDILQLIETEQARRRAADAEHVRRLAREQRGDLGAWCAARRHAVRAAAMALLLALPAGWYMLLPQRVDESRVLCNIKGEEQLVVNRACAALGSCDNPAVARLWPDGGGTL
jgi:hypothetical protein